MSQSNRSNKSANNGKTGEGIGCKKRPGEGRSTQCQPPAKKQKQASASSNAVRSSSSSPETTQYPSVSPMHYVLEAYFDDYFNRINSIHSENDLTRDATQAIFVRPMRNSFPARSFSEALCWEMLNAPARGLPAFHSDGTTSAPTLIEWNVRSASEQDNVLQRACSRNFKPKCEDSPGSVQPTTETPLQKMFSDPALFFFFVSALLRICEDAGLLTVENFKNSGSIDKAIALAISKAKDAISKNFIEEEDEDCNKLHKKPARKNVSGESPLGSNAADVNTNHPDALQAQQRKGETPRKTPIKSNVKKEQAPEREISEPEQTDGDQADGPDRAPKKTCIPSKSRKMEKIEAVNNGGKPPNIKMFVRPPDGTFLLAEEGEKIETCANRADIKHVGWQVVVERWVEIGGDGSGDCDEGGANGEEGGRLNSKSSETSTKGTERVVFRWSYAVAICKPPPKSQKTGSSPRTKPKTAAPASPTFTLKVLTAKKVNELGLGYSLDSTKPTGANVRGGKTAKALTNRSKSLTSQDRKQVIASHLSQAETRSANLILYANPNNERDHRQISKRKTFAIPKYPENSLPRNHKLAEYYTTGDFMTLEELDAWVPGSVVILSSNEPRSEEEVEKEVEEDGEEKGEEEEEEEEEERKRVKKRKGEKKENRNKIVNQRFVQGSRTADNSPEDHQASSTVLASELAEFCRPVEDFCDQLNKRIAKHKPGRPEGSNRDLETKHNSKNEKPGQWVSKKTESDAAKSILDTRATKAVTPKKQPPHPPPPSRAQLKTILQKDSFGQAPKTNARRSKDQSGCSDDGESGEGEGTSDEGQGELAFPVASSFASKISNNLETYSGEESDSS